MTQVTRTARQLITLTIALIPFTTALGWIATLDVWGSTVEPPDTSTGLLWGALAGISASAVIAVHHSVRVFFGRTPEGEQLVESRTPERRRAISSVAEHTLADATSLFAPVAVFCALSGGLAARILPAAGLATVLAIFALRLRAANKTSV